MCPSQPNNGFRVISSLPLINSHGHTFHSHCKMISREFHWTSTDSDQLLHSVHILCPPERDSLWTIHVDTKFSLHPVHTPGSPPMCHKRPAQQTTNSNYSCTSQSSKVPFVISCYGQSNCRYFEWIPLNYIPPSSLKPTDVGTTFALPSRPNPSSAYHCPGFG